MSSSNSGKTFLLPIQTSNSTIHQSAQVRTNSVVSHTLFPVGVEEDDINMPPILGQVDLIEDGMVVGWACEKGDPYKAHEVIDE